MEERLMEARAMEERRKRLEKILQEMELEKRQKVIEQTLRKMGAINLQDGAMRKHVATEIAHDLRAHDVEEAQFFAHGYQQ